MKQKIIHNWEVIYTLGMMDLKQKYQNSKLGMLWSFLRPLLQFAAYYFVFGYTLKIDTSEDYPLRLFFGIIIWTCFTEGTSMGLNAYFGKKSLVTKIKINMKLIPVAAYFTAALSFFINLSIFMVLYYCFGTCWVKTFHFHDLLVFLGTFILLSVTIVNLNIILATLNALFRDVQTIWELLMIYGVFLMPIMYPVSISKEYLPIYYCINTVAFPLETIRALFFDASSNLWEEQAYVTAYLLGVVLIAAAAFIVDRKWKDKVADYL